MKPLQKPTTEIFLKWRSPKHGSSNPENMDNPFWHWCVQNPDSAYMVNKAFDGPSAFSDGPCWCFDRMGQAQVDLPDGRKVFIGGEHEDYYDPDFYIYNDVIVISKDQIEIFGYPKNIFVPTDFHTATLVKTDIFLIGNLGYPENRNPKGTQVYQLNTLTWAISSIETNGDIPGWIHKHTASYIEAENAIMISGGKFSNERLLENFNEYKLCLDSMVWTQLTHKKWDRWILERVDQKTNQLWQIRSELMTRKFNLPTNDLIPNMHSEPISEEQLEGVSNLYKSPFTGILAEEDTENYGRYLLNIDGVKVRFDENMSNIMVTIEGTLSDERAKQLLVPLQQNLSKIDNAPYKLTQIKS